MSPKIAEKIRIELAKRNKSYVWLAEQLKTSSQNLYAFMNRLENNKSVRTDTLEKIGKILELNFFA